MKTLLVGCVCALLLFTHDVSAVAGVPGSIHELAPFPTKSLQSSEILKKCGINGSAKADLACFYLQQGPLTRMTDAVSNAADAIENGKNTEETVTNIATWLRENMDGDCSNSRDAVSANTILLRGCASGCTDYAVAFVAIARFKGIPATVTETVREKWVSEMVREREWHVPKEGHFFSEVYLYEEGTWVIFNPAGNKFVARDVMGYFPSGPGGNKRFMLFERGLDPADYGLRTDAAFSDEVRRRYYLPQ